MEIKSLPGNIPPAAALGVQLGIVGQLYIGLLTRLLQPHGVTYAQFAMLVHLSRRSMPARVSDIAEAVDLTQPAISKSVQKFVKLGWLSMQRDGVDQRNRPVTMTELGRARVATIQREFGPTFTAMLKGWTAEDIGALTASLSRLAQWLDANRRAEPIPPTTD